MRAELPILGRGEDWVVVAKPPWLLVHRSRGASGERYALQLVRDTVGRHVHPIHRLDRQTSGCLLFALDRSAIPRLQDALTASSKQYLAMVRGRWQRDGEVTVDRPLRDEIGVERAAHSWVRCVGTSAEPRCSLLSVHPITGRTHQIRRHVRGLDHPILGDATHGDSRANRFWRETHGLPRMALHCLSLSIEGETILCPLHVDLHRLWSAMPWWDAARVAVPALDLSPTEIPDYLAGHEPTRSDSGTDL